MSKFLIPIAAAIILMAAPAWADFQKGMDAFNPGDYHTALREWEQYGEQSDAKVQYALGAMYEFGRPGFRLSIVEAVKWYRWAAKQDHAHAQYSLGVIYGSDERVTPDYVQAHMWLSLAIPRLPQRKYRARAVNSRDIIAAKMTPAQIAEARRLAREWKPKKESR